MLSRGGDIFPEDIENNMAVLPEVEATTKEVIIYDIGVDDPHATPEERERLRRIIWKRRHLLIGAGNALPPAAYGAICDVDVGTAKPVAQRCRRVAPQFREQLSMLLKEQLSAKIITNSTSPWASPIVVIIKANGVDIRLCSTTSLTRLMVYPMPLINDLLEDLDKALWYCFLDMTIGFWVVSMTPRARLVSAFITSFGLFEWTKMPFRLKNAPKIYQRTVDNAIYGHMHIKPDQDRSDRMDVFKEGEPEPEPKPSVLGRRSYVDGILVTDDTWDSMCKRVDKLLDVCDRWNLSIKLLGSTQGGISGTRSIPAGLEAKPKELEAIANLPFPTKLKAMQSFLGSLDYYSRFVEAFAVYAVILYEQREADFHEIARMNTEGTRETQADDGLITAGERDRWARAKNAFTMLKAKIIATPVLKHFVPERTPVIVLYSNKWAISAAALIQEHKGVYHPVTSPVAH
ncbi:reverse transcriptase [Phytophthora megakarya]|uniref:Reverse transcriptase n=1 Tax=Phytophthora megakarya TaxID=4795 RepID=A0A225WPB0_9STRA|nr:reverse transcriptase [Phytophthora megakarya]